MRHLLDLVYLLCLVVLAPWLVYKALRTGKYRRGWRAKFTGKAPVLAGGAPRIWFHGVSVGEIHLLRQVIAAYRLRHPHWQCVVSTTTDTGYEEARKHFADLTVFHFPFDFSWSVRRALRSIAPELVVLAEGELWPNFLRTAKKFGAKVVVVNGRMSPRSGRRYRQLRWLTGPLWRCLDLLAVQTQDYAEAFRLAGVAPDRIRVTGSVKYDGVQLDRQHPSVTRMRELLSLRADERIWVCGSTQAPEESLALAAFQRLSQHFPTLRLVLVPRQRDRFDEVATLIQHAGMPLIRRSLLTERASTQEGVILVDSIGELSGVWGLAEIAFVGGSLDGKRGGQNMLEPAAYGAAVLFGPHVWNFREASTRLLEAGGAIQIQDADELEKTVADLLRDDARRDEMGEAARAFVLAQQGATARTLDVLDTLLPQPSRRVA